MIFEERIELGESVIKNVGYFYNTETSLFNMVSHKRVNDLREYV